MVKERCPGRVVCCCLSVTIPRKFVPVDPGQSKQKGLNWDYWLGFRPNAALPLAPYQPQAVNLSIPSVPTPKLGSVKRDHGDGLLAVRDPLSSGMRMEQR